MNSREAFEMYVEDGEYLALDRDASGEYLDRQAQAAWEAWQAATERAAGIVIEEGVVISSHGVAMAANKIREGNE